MKKLVVIILLVLVACKTETKEALKVDKKKPAKEVAKLDVEAIKSIDLSVYNFNELEPLLNKKDNKTYVVNFWATWCAPCVKELPYFEEVNKKYNDKSVEVILVSLDFPKQYEKKLKPFMVKHKLQSKIVALNDTDSNTWIPKINKNWSGAIPATIIYNKSKRQFYEKSFNYEELETELKTFLN